MLNFSILKNPINWAIVIFMLVIAGFVVDVVSGYVTRNNNGPSNGAVE